MPMNYIQTCVKKVTNQLIVFDLLLVFLVASLYGQFLHNPIVFDDLTFFMVDVFGKQPIDNYVFRSLELRSLPYATLAWTKTVFGLDLIYFRIGGLLLHAVCVISIFELAKLVLFQTYKPKNKNSITVNQSALLTAACFAVNPMAVYAAGYLIQRTIVMATMFGLLTMLVYAKGVIENKSHWLWCAVPLYYLSVYSKEHAIMLVPVLVALTILLSDQWVSKIRKNIYLFATLSVISLMVLATRWNMFGSVYEPDAKDLLGLDLGVWAHPLSVLTQCGLFFKYIVLWLLPDISRTSIDMRETFQRTFFDWYIVAIPAYLAWGGVAIWLLLQRGSKGLVGFSMFFPWVLFFTEFFSVRIQEPFVLYRSYLWASAGFFFLPVLVSGVTRKIIGFVGVAVIATYFLLSMERLATLSNPILLWMDAKQLVEKNPQKLGSERIYYNLGRNLFLNDQLSEAEENLKQALKIEANLAPAHGVLGAIYIKQKMWHESVKSYTAARDIETKLGHAHGSVYLVGRAKAYEGAGMGQLAIQDYLEACRINENVCKMLRKIATPID